MAMIEFISERRRRRRKKKYGASERTGIVGVPNYFDTTIDAPIGDSNGFATLASEGVDILCEVRGDIAEIDEYKSEDANALNNVFEKLPGVNKLIMKCIPGDGAICESLGAKHLYGNYFYINR
jgi:hypothetical protein